MKRRTFLKTVAAVPAAPALLAQTPSPSGETALTFAPLDVAGQRAPRFFDSRRHATLTRLCDLLEPAVYSNAPSALESRVPEFLDFYISQCPRERQQLYLEGLELLEARARERFNRTFPQTEPAQAAELLSSLRAAWTYDPPDRLAEFLRDARNTVRAATRNSYEWDRVGRGATGTFWKPVE